MGGWVGGWRGGVEGLARAAAAAAAGRQGQQQKHRFVKQAVKEQPFSSRSARRKGTSWEHAPAAVHLNRGACGGAGQRLADAGILLPRTHSQHRCPRCSLRSGLAQQRGRCRLQGQQQGAATAGCRRGRRRRRCLLKGGGHTEPAPGWPRAVGRFRMNCTAAGQRAGRCRDEHWRGESGWPCGRACTRSWQA